MKKVFALILALVMVFALCGVAFAGTIDDVEAPNNTNSSDVSISVSAATGGTIKYHVAIKWEDLTFTYTNANAGSWDPQNHIYTDTEAAHWNKTTANFYIENHSNAAISYSTAFVPKNDVVQPNGVTITATHTGTLDSADDNAYRADNSEIIDGYKAGPNETLTVTVSGTPNEAYSSAVVGSIVVTISAVEP